MKTKPIWQLVQDCARELTRNGHLPFTRKDLISCVKKHDPGCSENSINPVIQGLTHNLKGGAPVADGKHVLYSVGRGQFVLYSKRNDFGGEVKTDVTVMTSKPQKTCLSVFFPETENELRDHILGFLKEELPGSVIGSIVPEGQLSYTLPGGVSISHASDILITTSQGKLISIELKFKSAVTDQFKCRAYDAIHIKREYGDKISNVMIFVKSKSGVSIKQARILSYPFDIFIGLQESDIGRDEFISEVVGKVSALL